METNQLWARYARIWLSDPETRDRELEVCLADDATYCDPNGAMAGRDALSAYMAGFQNGFPGHGFRILDVVAHEGGSLARWDQVGADGSTQHLGISFASHDGQGRLRNINGFFPFTRTPPT